MTERNIFARSPLSLSAVIISAVVLLAILGRLAVVFGSVLRLFAAPVAAEPMPSSLLLNAILVTLVVIAVLLAAILWRLRHGVRRP